MNVKKSEKYFFNCEKHTNIKVEVGKRLLELRKNHKYNQDFVANQIGISRAALSYYEKGERSIDIEILYKLAEFYEISIDYLFGISGKQSPQRSYTDTFATAEMGFTSDAEDVMWGNPQFVDLINSFVTHPDFETFEELTYHSRYTEYDDIDRKYRSFLVSQLLYSMVSDIFNDWYSNNPDRIIELSHQQKEELLKDIDTFYNPHSYRLLDESGNITPEYSSYILKLEQGIVKLRQKLLFFLNKEND